MTLLSNLETGSVFNAFNVRTDKGVVTVDSTPSERVVYPQGKDQLIVVGPGKMVVLTSYIQIETTVKVSKILLSNGVPETGVSSNCCYSVKSAEVTTLAKVDIPGYAMCNDKPITVIDIPGVYMVKVDTESDEGDVIVTAMEYGLQSVAPQLPPTVCETTPRRV